MSIKSITLNVSNMPTICDMLLSVINSVYLFLISNSYTVELLPQTPRKAAHLEDVIRLSEIALIQPERD